jgi:hypothetical protein
LLTRIPASCCLLTTEAGGLRLSDVEQAINFVNERGFVYFWPIKGIVLPTLWVATAGERPVPNDHDDSGQIT